MMRLDANIPLLALACLISLIIIIPAITVVSGVDARVGAPIDIAITSAFGVENITFSHVRSVGPDTGNFSLSSSDIVQLWVVAEFIASPSVLISSADGP